MNSRINHPVNCLPKGAPVHGRAEPGLFPARIIRSPDRRDDCHRKTIHRMIDTGIHQLTEIDHFL